MTVRNSPQAISTWLLEEARFNNDAIKLVEELGKRLVDAGIPIARMRVAQRFANPLIAAWGTIWRSDGTPTVEYTVPLKWLETDIWIGSPFQYVTEERRSLRKRLVNLDPDKDYHLFFELAEEGGTDFFAMPLEYADGTAQGMSIVTEHPDGFDDSHIDLLETIRHPLAAVMEPIAVRRSLASLLKTYLGSGPSGSVVSGAIFQGDVTRIQAAIMMTDMRDFTRKSINWSEDQLIETLGVYFEMVVEAVHKNGGDVLKFIGDGILAVFPATEEFSAQQQASNAIQAAKDARTALKEFTENNEVAGVPSFEFGTGIHFGEVIYGNIGSPDRLDFTVVGEAVNLASRLETATKKTGHPVLCSKSVAELTTNEVTSIGVTDIRGLDERVELFSLK